MPLVYRPSSFQASRLVALTLAYAYLACAIGSISSNGTSSSSATAKTANSSGDYVGYAALCAVAKNENRYVREWAEYHRCLGFSRIYLYDHESEQPMSDQLDDLIASGFVRYSRFSGHHKRYSRDHRPTTLEKFLKTAQGYAYKQCASSHRKKHSFLGFIDIDEFLVFTDPGITSVEQLLRPFNDTGGLALHWQLVGSSNHTARPDAPVTSSYTHCVAPSSIEHYQFKSFVNTAAKPTMQNPHRPSLGSTKGLRRPYLVDEQRKRVLSGSNNKPTHGKAAVMHYVIKSWEDYKQKLARGGGAGVKRNTDYFHRIDRKARHACLASPADLYRRLCPTAPPLPAPWIPGSTPENSGNAQGRNSSALTGL